MKTRFSRITLSLLAAPLALALAGCGSEEDAATAGAVTAEPIAAVPAPQGQEWSQMISQTESGGYLMGNPDAPIKLTEFGALSCSHCADFAEASFDPLVSDYIDSGRVSFELRFFLLNAFDMPATLLATCSTPEATIPLAEQMWENQAQFYEAAREAGDAALQQATTQPPESRFVRLAELFGMTDFVTARGISRDQAVSCLQDEAKATELANRVEEQGARYDVTGTPTFLLNDRKIDALSWEQVELALQNAGAR